MKILILAYEFPPNVSVGAYRAASFLKYLGTEQDELTVVTRKWSTTIQTAVDYSKVDDLGVVEEYCSEKQRIIYVPYRAQTLRDKLVGKPNFILSLIRKVISLTQLFSIWNTGLGDEKRFLFNHASKLMLKEKYDLVIATGEPFVLFKYAYLLNKKFNVPYILDYRDAWYSGERHKMNKSKVAAFVRNFQKRYEQKYLSKALLFSTVSEVLYEDIKRDFPFSSGIIIKNGVDLSALESIETFPMSEHLFTICYAGTVYDGHNVVLFLNALEKLFSIDADCVKVKFVGISLRPSKHMKLIEDFCKRFPLNAEILPPQPQNEVFRWLKSSQVLLKFSMRTTSKTAQSGKMYEYFAFKKPILHILNENAEQNDLLINKRVQFFAKTQQEVDDALMSLYHSWLPGSFLKTEVDDSDLEVFSRKGLAQNFRREIDKFINVKASI